MTLGNGGNMDDTTMISDPLTNTTFPITKVRKPRVDLTNRQFGTWKILEYASSVKRYTGLEGRTETRWKCQCTICGVTQDILTKSLLHPRRGKNGCKKCCNRKLGLWLEAYELDRDGLSYTEIGMKLGVHRSVAFRYVKKAEKYLEEKEKSENIL